MTDPDAARRALDSVDRERMHVVDHAMPRWMAPVMAVAIAGYFAVQDLAGPAVRHAMVFVFTLGYLGFVIGPLVRRHRDEQARLRAESVPGAHRRRSGVAATVLLVLLLGGAVLLDRLTWPHAALVYGVAVGVVVLAGGWWLRHALARQLRTGP